MPTDIYMVRSDQGDGGWSLHAEGTEDEDGIAPVLVKGKSERNEAGEWERPNAADYAEARAKIEATE